MMTPDHESQSSLSRKLMAVEWVKAELLAESAKLFRALVNGTAEAVIDALAGILIAVYVLAMRVGVNPAKIEQKAIGRLNQSIADRQELEVWFGDLSRLQRYLSKHD